MFKQRMPVIMVTFLHFYLNNWKCAHTEFYFLVFFKVLFYFYLFMDLINCMTVIVSLVFRQGFHFLFFYVQIDRRRMTIHIFPSFHFYSFPWIDAVLLMAIFTLIAWYFHETRDSEIPSLVVCAIQNWLFLVKQITTTGPCVSQVEKEFHSRFIYVCCRKEKR
jgi:hypothetical protein